MSKTKLVLGPAAGTGSGDFISVDINPDVGPDVVHDLNKVPWPFSDNQFKQITCHHVLEHLDSLDGPMSELHRVCAAGGEVYIEVPHRTSWCADSHYHKLRFNWFGLDDFLAGKGEKWRPNDKKFEIIERKLTFHKAYRRYFLHKLFNKFPHAYERFWAFVCPAENMVWRIKPVK